jgi:SAM-dependent methyltransferase
MLFEILHRLLHPPLGYIFQGCLAEQLFKMCCKCGAGHGRRCGEGLDCPECIHSVAGQKNAIATGGNRVRRLNCGINLSTDKDRVLSEALRVLKPGGRFADSEVAVRGRVPGEVRKSMLLWVGCIAGALRERIFGETPRCRISSKVERVRSRVPPLRPHPANLVAALF